MKKFFNILFYVSLACLAVYLYKFDYFTIPVISDYYSAVFSVVLLFVGFILQAITWEKTLKLFNIFINYKLAISSSGLSIFMKYIPGKVMVVLGRAAYISSKKNINISKTTTASFLNQIITLWVGLFLGSIIIFTVEIPSVWKIVSIIIFLFLTLIMIFNAFFFSVLKKILLKFRKKFEIEKFKMRDVFKVSPFFFLNWIFWSLGFYFLINSAYIGDVSFFLIFSFPLSASLGIIVLFAPGGLGIREGVIVGCLVLFKIPIEIATGISVLSRLWFLAGEFFIFITALVIDKTEKRNVTYK